MDFYRAVESLHKELRKVDEAIATLERLVSGNQIKAGSRRGRKSMSPEERRVVSERMRKYWESRRSQPGAASTS